MYQLHYSWSTIKRTKTCKRGISLYNIYAKYNEIRYQFSFSHSSIFDKAINCVLDRAQPSFKKIIDVCNVYA